MHDEADALKIYEREREKRLAAHAEGLEQYLDMNATVATLDSFAEDPWVARGTPIHRVVPKDGHVECLVVGAGFSGLIVAVKLLQAGVRLEDILIVDPAGGYGGTWYWNRFPGLMCDIESYIYLPLLEETGYMPTEKYASGDEIRRYAELIAHRYGLPARTMFQTTVGALTWNDADTVWDGAFVERPKGLPEEHSRLTATFVVLASGVLTGAKVPNVPGVGSFQGYSFHTSRWDYDYTGGTPTDPAMHKLADKRVAFVGTGATGVQAVPALARHAKELYVFQRTASAVDERGQKATDPQEWKEKIASTKGWWYARNENFHAFTESEEPSPAVNLVDDAFAHMKAYGAVFGSPVPVTPDGVQQYVRDMHARDLPRSERIRQRARETVTDAETGRAWYPGWCKRPCFHDDYLPAFNRPSVHLVDAEDGKGITRVTEKGIVADGQEYAVDLIVWGTGYGSPLKGSMAGRAGIAVTGTNGTAMEQAALAGTMDSLHGCIARDFPNFLYQGIAQVGVGPNQTHRMDVVGTHIAYIVAETKKRAKGKPRVQVTPEAAEAWAQRVASTALTGAPMLDCTPSYFNLEGDIYRVPDDVKARLARGGPWGRGLNDFARLVEKWRADGDLHGLEISAA